MGPNTSWHLPAVQAYRGVAALLVVVVHAINVVDYRQSTGIDASPAWLNSAFALNEAGAMGVDLFFVISGFVMAMMLTRSTDVRMRDFAYARFVRIAPLFWLASFAFAPVLLLAGRVVDYDAMLTSVTIIPVLPGHYVSPLLVVGWSLAFELAFYMVVAMSLLLPPRWRLSVVAAILAIGGTLGAVAPPLPGLWAVLANAMLFEFLIGVGCFLLWRRLLGRVGHILPWAMIVLGGAMLVKSAVTGFGFATSHMAVMAGETGLARTLIWALPWSMILLGAVLRAPVRQKPGWLHKLGDASYSLYLVHMVIFTVAETGVPPAMVQPDILVPLLIGVAVAAGFGVYARVEKPTLAALKRTPWLVSSRAAQATNAAATIDEQRLAVDARS